MIMKELEGTKHPRSGEQVKIPLLPNKVGKRSRTRVTTIFFIKTATCDPPLKAKNPKRRMNPPIAAIGTECPGMSTGLPFSSNRPLLGPIA